MTRLILTSDASSASALQDSGIADVVIPVLRRFVWGPLPSEAELAKYLAPRVRQRKGGHWLDHALRRDLAPVAGRKPGVLTFIDRCESVELWIDSRPNDQLVLIWLLSALRDHAELAAKIVLRHVDAPLFDALPEQLATWTCVGSELRREHLDLAHSAWRAFRAPTPQAWFDLLKRDLSPLPQLRRTVREMLDELPGPGTGLGASELRILELLSAGYQHPFDLFPHFRERFQRRVYDYWEAGRLLDGLASAPVPAVAGLAEWPFTLDLHENADRFDRYQASRLSLTPLGRAILAGEEDFARLNPIRRWWGGTGLTPTNLWRWGGAPIAPGTDTLDVFACREPDTPAFDWSFSNAPYSAASA